MGFNLTRSSGITGGVNLSEHTPRHIPRYIPRCIPRYIHRYIPNVIGIVLGIVTSIYDVDGILNDIVTMGSLLSTSSLRSRRRNALEALSSSTLSRVFFFQSSAPAASYVFRSSLRANGSSYCMVPSCECLCKTECGQCTSGAFHCRVREGLPAISTGTSVPVRYIHDYGSLS